MLAQREGVAVGQAAAEGPAFIAVFGQEGIVRSEKLETIRNGLAENMDVSEVELAGQAVKGEEVPGEALAGPEADLRLYHPVLPLHIVFPRPGIEVSGDVQGEPGRKPHFHSQVEGGRCVVQQVGLYPYHLRTCAGGGT